MSNIAERRKCVEILNHKFKELDITQKRLADLTGIKPHRIYSYLRGEVLPKGTDLRVLCNVLDLDFDTVLDEIIDEGMRYDRQRT